jgi:hypothetical protein
VTLSLARVKVGPTATGPTYEFAGSTTGDISTPGLPSQVTALIKKNTNLGGRQGQGRMFIPGILEADVNSAGFWESGRQAAWQTAADDLFDAIQALGVQPALLRSESSPISTPEGITSFTVQPQVATQRRRLRG